MKNLTHSAKLPSVKAEWKLQSKRKDTLNTPPKKKKKSKNCKGRRGWQKERDEAPSYFFCKHSNQKRRASKKRQTERESLRLWSNTIPFHPRMSQTPDHYAVTDIGVLRFQTIMHLRLWKKGLRFQAIMQLRILECSDSRPIMHLWLWKGLDSTPLCNLQELSIKTILVHNFPQNFTLCKAHILKHHPLFWLITCCNRLLEEGHKQCPFHLRSKLFKDYVPSRGRMCYLLVVISFLFFLFSFVGCVYPHPFTINSNFFISYFPSRISSKL